MRLSCILLMFFSLTACLPVTTGQNAPPSQHRQWAQELISINDIEGALIEMRQTLAGNPNIEDALLYADLFESRGEYKQARRVYQKALKYPADTIQQQALNYRLGLVEAVAFDNLKTAAELAETLPLVDSRLFDLKSVILLKKARYKEALLESQRALAKAGNNEEKGWAYFHMAQIYYELKIERETFVSLFKAINNGRGHGLVSRITEYWDARRHTPFPEK